MYTYVVYVYICMYMHIRQLCPSREICSNFMKYISIIIIEYVRYITNKIHILLMIPGFEYRIPPLWKRFAAEFIDSAMLFLLKFCITYIAIDVFDFMYVYMLENVFFQICFISHIFIYRNIEDLDVLEVNLHLDYKMALEITYGLLILETIHRVIVCIFEVRIFKIR